MKQLALIGAASSAGARRTGQERAPQLFRRVGICDSLRKAGLEVIDCGDIPTVEFEPDMDHPKAQNLGKVVDVALGVADKVSAAVRHQFFPIVLGGDCTVTIGVLEGLRRHHNDLGLMYFDGDVDLNTPETTNTGIFDGMVLAHILGNGAPELCKIGGHSPLVQEEKVVLFGYNLEAGWMDPAEIEFLHHTSMMKYPVLSIRGKVQPMALEATLRLEKKVERYLVHFDVDVVDFHDLPVGDVPHDRGLSLQEVIDALQTFVSSPRCVGLVITEFNVLHDADGSHARRLIREIVRVLARSQTR